MTAQTILPANTLSSGFDVGNSVRFNRADSAILNKTFDDDGTHHDKGTISLWIKRNEIGAEEVLFSAGANNREFIRFESNDTLTYRSVAESYHLNTNRVFRDVSAWYHIVVAFDSSQGTASNRNKIYVNGVQETSFATETYTPNQNMDHKLLSGELNSLGKDSEQNAFAACYFCEVVGIDGVAHAPTSFGEFDEDSGIWKPKSVSGLTFGTNGFHLNFADSSALGTDVSGNGNNFANTNLAATDQSTDTCTNNACTWNTLYRNSATFTQGNLVYQAPGSNPVFGSITTFGVSAGKWYAECKYVAGSSHYGIIGICDEVFATLGDLGSATNTDFGKTGAALGSHPNTCTVAYVINTGKIRNNNNNQNYGSGGGDGDIINIALDRDNRKVYFGINGTYENSGNPAAGSNGFDLSSQVTGNEYFLGVTNDTGASETILDFNFGGGFGQTAVSSANADANGHGNFEYAVPSGFFAWNTKNLAENG